MHKKFCYQVLGLLGSLFLCGCQHFTHNSAGETDIESRVAGISEHIVLTQPPLPEQGIINFKKAQNYVLAHSNRLLAAQAGWRASLLQAEALDDLHKPLVLVSGMAGRYSVSTDVSTANLRERLKGYGDDLSAQLGLLAGQLPPNLAQALAQLPSSDSLIAEIPSEVHLSRQDDFSRANLVAMMPLYTGGRISAVKQYAHGRADVYASEVVSTKEELLSELIKRYFQVQLAQRVVELRRVALIAITSHDHAAKRMLETGLISKTERLQGSAALSDAKFQLEKAEDNLRLAQRALNSLLGSEQVTLSTGLFVNSKKLPPLVKFQEKAHAQYPAFAKIEAKSKQAEAMKTLSDAAWKPSVSAFGSHEIGGKHNWVVGVSARWTLHKPIDRNKMQQASEMSLAQIEAVRRQAQEDVDLLVEKNWLAVHDARHYYASLAEEERLAQEVLKLQSAGFREGLNTIMDVNDAQAKLIKVQTERAYATYEYVIALSNLLASVGDIHTFVDYIPNKD